MILDDFKLTGQVAVITGGNRGLGLGIATALAEAGADIVSIQRSSDTAALQTAVTAAGRTILPISADIGQTESAQAALDAVLSKFGRADILVNNAGVQKRHKAEQFPLADWDQVINVNMRAVFVYCQVFGRHMLAHGGGKIINIASLLSFQGGITVPAYAAAKHAVAGLTQALCNEWSGAGINVNAIAPGYCETDMNEALIADPVRSQAIGARIPAGRWGQPKDMGGAAVFLASRAADYIHGQVLCIDGGWMAR